MEPKRVVIICIDHSEHSFRGFQWYLENLHQNENEVRLVHVYIQPNIPNIGLFGAGFSALESYRHNVENSINESRLVVKKYQDICAEKGIAAKCHVAPVDVSVGRTIIKIANEHKAVLIVIGSRGLGTIKSTLFGSVRYLETLHDEHQKIGLIHVHTPPDIPSLGYIHGTIDLHKKEIQRSIDASKAVIDKFEQICLDKNIRYHMYLEVLENSIGHTICKVAQTRHASLLIVGQRGLGTIRRTLFGSVSDYVLRHSHIPTIVVPPNS